MQSLPSKLNEILAFVQLNSPTFLLFIETWLKPSIPDVAVSIPGYSIFRSDSVVTPGHAGVCVFMRDENLLDFHLSVSSINTPGIDNIFLDICGLGISVTLACIYRPRQSSHDDTLFRHLSHLSNTKQSVVVAGDFNFPDISWPLTTLPPVNSPTSEFVNVIISSSFSQIVTEPTRIRMGQRPSLLDLLMTTDENILSDLEYLPPFGKSDHLVLKSNLHLFTTNPPKCTNKTFKQINYHDLNRDLEKIDWRNLLVGNVESMWGAFLGRFSTVQCLLTPQ